LKCWSGQLLCQYGLGTARCPVGAEWVAMTTLLALSVIGIAVGILAAARIVDLLDGQKGETEKNA